MFSNSDFKTFSSKLGYSFVAIAVFAMLPWLLLKPLRGKRSRIKAAKEKAFEAKLARIEQGLPAKQPPTRVEKWQRIFKYGFNALVFYYLFLVFSVFVPGVIKQLYSAASPLNQPGASSKQLSELLGLTLTFIWDYTKDVFSTQQIGKVLLVIVVIGVIHRLVKFSLFIQRKVNKKSKA